MQQLAFVCLLGLDVLGGVLVGAWISAGAPARARSAPAPVFGCLAGLIGLPVFGLVCYLRKSRYPLDEHAGALGLSVLGGLALGLLLALGLRHSGRSASPRRP